METTPVQAMNTSSVLSESKRIVRANYTHFLTLASFFLPFTLSLGTGQLFNVHHIQKNLVHYFLCLLIVYIITLCTIAMITYSTYHALFGQPLTFFTTLRSLTSSFFPLVWTAIVAHILLFLILLTFLMPVGGILLFVQNLGFDVIDFNSIYFVCFSMVVGVILIVIMFYFYVNWSLAFVVVVVESKWGFAPLMRSSYLVKGMRSVSLCFRTGVVSMVWMAWMSSFNIHGISSWMFLLVGVLAAFFLTSYLVTFTAANVVLYTYCKAMHGELAMEVSQGLAHEYVSLPSDYEKVVPHADIVS